MKIHSLALPRSPGSRAGGFTMTELALCIAVVSVALVAIIGVLPTGLTVQRHNREETIITEDGKVWLNAIRTASTNSDNLLPRVDFVLWDRYKLGGQETTVSAGSLPFVQKAYRTASWNDSARLAPMGYSSTTLITNTTQLISLLSMPRYVRLNNVDYLNVVRAQIRAIGGALTEKSIRPQADPGGAGPDGLTLDQRNEFAFRYLMTPEVTDVALSPVGSSVSQTLATAQQIHELALTFQWPVVLRAEKGTVERMRVGNNRRVYRTQVFSPLAPLNSADAKYLGASDIGLQLFTPGSF